MTTSKTVLELQLFAKIIGAIAATITGLWFLFSASVDRYVDKRVDAFIHTAEYKADHERLTDAYIRSADFEKFYVEFATERYKNRVGLRELLSAKMGVDADEVAIELGKLYRTEGELRTNLLELSRRIRELENRQ